MKKIKRDRTFGSNGTCMVDESLIHKGYQKVIIMSITDIKLITDFVPEANKFSKMVGDEGLEPPTPAV